MFRKLVARNWIAFNAYDNDNDAIYIVSSTGGEPKKIPVNIIRRGGGGMYGKRLSLSYDGKLLAFSSSDINLDKATVEKELPRSIYTYSVDDGTIIHLTGDNTGQQAFSPDGKMMVYIKHLRFEGGYPVTEGWVIPVKGGPPNRITDPAIHVSGPIWSPDGRMIAFTRRNNPEHSDLTQVMIVSVSEYGKLLNIQKTINLPQDTYISPAGWSSNNTIGLHLVNPKFQAIYTVPFPGGKATQVTPDGWANNPCWSADGKRILYRWEDQLRSVPKNGGESSKIPIESEERTYEVLPGGGNHISPDGKSLLYAGYSPGQEEGGIHVHLMVMPVEGGKPEVITQSPTQDRYPCWSPDGKSIAFIRNHGNSKGNIVIHIFTVPAGGGDVKQITLAQDSVHWSSIKYTPDGNHIAYFSLDKSIKLIPVHGGESRELVKVESLGSHNEIIMLRDGKHMAYTSDGKIWMIPLTGGEPVQIETGLSDWYHSQIDQSPDGKTIAFTAFTGGDSDLWLMENFLPLEKLPLRNETEDFMIRKVIDGTGAGFVGGNPSPDGKYFAFVDWSTYPNDIVIKEIGTEKEIRLKNQTDLNYEGDTGDPYFPIWSPDSKKIAYTWENEDEKFYELRVIEIDNSEPDVLIRVSYREGWVQAEDWSPDGQHILVQLTKNGQDQIGLISIKDGSFKQLKEFDASNPASVRFSPDGHHIAYDFSPNKETTNNDIYILSIDGKRESKLTSHPSHDYLLDWTPSGMEILFASDRTGTTDMWSISLDGVTPQEKPKLIKKNVGLIMPLGSTNIGSLYFSTPGSWWDIYTVTIDPETGKVTEPPTEVPLPYQGYNRRPTWSSNGKYLAYISDLGELRRPNILSIYTKETGSSKELIQKETYIIPRWFPDSQSILVNQTDVIKIATGEITPFIKLEQDAGVYSLNISSDKKYIYYAIRDKNWKIHSIIRRNLESEEENELYRTNDANLTMALSPDGMKLAVMSLHNKDTRILKILSTMDSSEKIIYTYKHKEFGYKSIAWSPDGKYIYFSERTGSEEKRPDELCRIPATGGDIENLGVNMHLFTDISIHPDGRLITFASFVGLEKPGRVWEMKNFLPATK